MWIPAKFVILSAQLVSDHSCAITVATKQTRTMKAELGDVLETAKRVVFLTAQTQRISMVSAESWVSENILIFWIGRTVLRVG